MTTGNIAIPTLPKEKIEEIQALFAAGETVKAICEKTKTRYSVAWFYAVNKGEPVKAELVPSDGTCWCGRIRHAKGLCKRHYMAMLRAMGRAA